MYFVMVTRCDEYAELGDLATTQYYGPFRTREKAEEQAERARGGTANFDFRAMVAKLSPGPVPRFRKEPNYNTDK